MFSSSLAGATAWIALECGELVIVAQWTLSLPWLLHDIVRRQVWVSGEDSNVGTEYSIVLGVSCQAAESLR
jgi:hypothetical protein